MVEIIVYDSRRKEPICTELNSKSIKIGPDTDSDITIKGLETSLEIGLTGINNTIYAKTNPIYIRFIDRGSRYALFDEKTLRTINLDLHCAINPQLTNPEQSFQIILPNGELPHKKLYKQPFTNIRIQPGTKIILHRQLKIPDKIILDDICSEETRDINDTNIEILVR